MSIITRTFFILAFTLCLLLPPVTATHAVPPACNAATEGTIVYNAQHKLVQFCNGTQWIGLTAKIGGAGDTLSDLNCLDGQTIEWTGTAWTCADGGGLAALQGTDDTGACTPAKDGLIRYRAAGDPHWEYCHGGTTSWLPFRLPQCQDDDAGVCTLAASRIANDPQFKPSSIRCGDKLLGVTGTYGSGSSAPFTFTDVSNAALSTLTAASAVTISGIPAGCPGEVFVSGQGNPQISINGGTWSTTGSIANGQTLAVRLTSSASFSTAHTATISIGSTEDTWSVTTLAADTTPNAFTFTDVTNAELSTLTTSNTITISGINTSTPVSVTGTGAQISINGGAWTTSGNITNGQTLAVRLTSSASFNTAMAATVNVGGVTDSWSVTTIPADTTPNAFDFTPNVTNANLSTLITAANTVSISGINTGTPVSVTGTGAQIEINGSGTWVTSGTIQNGQTLRLRLTSSASFNTAITATVNVGGVTDTWSVTTLPADTTPNAFTFADVTGANPSTLTTATAITISGINTSTPVSVTGTGAQISINGGAWTTSGNITNGQTLAVRLTSSASFNTAMTTTVNVGGVTDSWSVTTRVANNCTVASGTTWAVAGKTCTAPSALTINHGSTGSRTDSTEPTTGSATWSCNDGTPSITASTCVESCAASQTVSWSPGCSALSGALLANGANRSITNSTSGYTGTRVITCNNGTLAQSGGSCAASLKWTKIGADGGSGNCSPANPEGLSCSNAGATCRGSPTSGKFGQVKTLYRCQ